MLFIVTILFLIFVVNTENVLDEMTHEESSVHEETNGAENLEDSTEESAELREEVKNGHDGSLLFYLTVREEEVRSKKKFDIIISVSFTTVLRKVLMANELVS